MRSEDKPIGIELVLHIGHEEARELANGIISLYKRDKKKGGWKWTNAAVATLDSQLTEFLNRHIKLESDK